MTTRAQLQSKSIDELRTIASTAGIEIDGLQKSKLITALMDAGAVIPESAAKTVIGQAVWAVFTGPVLIVVIKYVDDRWEKYASARDKEFA